MDINDTGCSYVSTRDGGGKFTQAVGSCLDCFGSEHNDVCLYCLNKCHEGHRLGKITKKLSQCDCGQNRCVSIDVYLTEPLILALII